MTLTEFKQQYQPILPEAPGVYRYINAENTILYVGKAKNLLKRVSSYFTKTSGAYRTMTMLNQAVRIEWTVVNNEKDALLLENTLIKEYQPRYNVFLKDSKSYPYILLTNEPFPKVFFTRRRIPDGGEYFGPYTSVFRVREILEFIRTLFQLRTCKLELTDKNINAGKFKVCLEYHIGNCKGPCAGLQSKEEYDKNLRHVRQLLRGRVGPVLQLFKEEMQEAAAALRFEEADSFKRKIEALELYKQRSTVVNIDIDNVDVFYILDDETYAYINYIKIAEGSIIQSHTVEVKKQMGDEDLADILELTVHKIRQDFESTSAEVIVPVEISVTGEVLVTIPTGGDKKKLLELSESNTRQYRIARLQAREESKRVPTHMRMVQQLQLDMKLTEMPVHIECFDNSNFQGSYPVASMVCFKNGKPSKKDYRHFNIKTVVGPDDFASMEEIVYRRYKRLLDEKQPLPQLVLIDGGKGQLGAALKSLDKLSLTGKMAVAGIAKRLEEIYFPGDNLPLYISKKSESLKLVQQIRNEAHRFAITFHRLKRDAGTLHSELLDIPGIGEKNMEALLTHFRSVKNISEATLDQLAEVIGKAKAQLVFNYFNAPELDA